MTANSSLPQPLLELRAQAQKRPDFHPETSPVLHEDLYRYILDHRDNGHGVIEIGCYKGSSSLVLAYACRELGMPFHTIDINASFLEDTRQLLSDLNLAKGTSFFRGTMNDFVKQIRLEEKPLLVFVDGDHSYAAVLEDIQAIYRLNQRPAALAFHDFSLRSFRYEGIRVDQALSAVFGPQVQFQRIGAQFGENPKPSKEQPSASGSYWEAFGSEGVIVETAAHPQLLV